MVKFISVVFVEWVSSGAFIFCLMFHVSQGHAQELNCTVSVDASLLRSFEAESRLKNFTTTVSNYLNDYRWTTNQEFELAEDRIECSMDFILKSADLTKTPSLFVCNLIIIVRRPVLNSRYKTSIFRFVDSDISFYYDAQSSVLLHNESVFQNEFNSLLDFYAYLILGLDADTFTSLGGQSYFTQASRIANLVLTSTNIRNWSSSGNSSRGGLISELLSESGSDFRKQKYEYHYNFLDALSTLTAEQTATILLSYLSFIATTAKQDKMIVRIFLDSKHLELARLLQKMPEKTKLEGKTLLLTADPARQNIYNQYLSTTRK